VCETYCSGAVIAMIEERISIIVPAYNEESRIGETLAQISRSMHTLCNDLEIIVVDDGSADKTAEAAVRAGSLLHEVRVVRYDHNVGKGQALLAGISFATGTYIGFLDADMELHPDQLRPLFEKLSTANCQAVIGSKHHPLSIIIGYPTIRRVYSFIYYAFVKMLFGLSLRDTQTGLKVFRADLLHDVGPRLAAKKFAFDLELLAVAHRLGYRRLEDAPVHVVFRRERGRINFTDVMHVLKDTAAIFYRMNILRYYDDKHANVHPLPHTVREEVVGRGRAHGS
jgi:glycosyltransferase involved in cell wall biosynthesis